MVLQKKKQLIKYVLALGPFSARFNTILIKNMLMAKECRHGNIQPTIYSSSKELLLYMRVDLGICLPTGQLPLDMVGSLLCQWIILGGLLLNMRNRQLKPWHNQCG